MNPYAARHAASRREKEMSTLEMLGFIALVWGTGILTLVFWAWLDKRKERKQERPPQAIPEWVYEDSIVRECDFMARQIREEWDAVREELVDRQVDELCRDPVRLNRLLEAIYEFEPGEDNDR